MKHLTILVSGRVQGVFYRAHARQLAEELQINGFIRNEPDGSVYIEAEGESPALKKFLKWCEEGPSEAEVSRVRIHKGRVEGYYDFEIRHD